jgi:hypothetical protein
MPRAAVAERSPIAAQPGVAYVFAHLKRSVFVRQDPGAHDVGNKGHELGILHQWEALGQELNVVPVNGLRWAAHFFAMQKLKRKRPSLRKVIPPTLRRAYPRRGIRNLCAFLYVQIHRAAERYEDPAVTIT